MNIIAASYQNLGPFQDTTVSVVLHPGKYLIKAPIGSGKSFLFFDGLVYALYGYSKRDMLNVHHDTGRSKVLFVVDNAGMFLIERSLTGKKGMQLYRVLMDLEEVTSLILGEYSDMLTWGKDCMELLPQNRLELISMHSSSEIQQYIDELLPPRTVFLQRHILMQDSENIFEMSPKARIDVLKLLFHLDALDTIRDSLSDKKNELKGQYKALSDSNHVQEQYVSVYQTIVSVVNRMVLMLSDKQDSESQNAFALLQETGIIDFIKNPLSDKVDNVDHDLSEIQIDSVQQYIQESKHQQIAAQANLSALQQQYVSLESKKQEVNIALGILIGRMSGFDIKLLENDPPIDFQQQALVDKQNQKAILEGSLKKLDLLVSREQRGICKKYISNDIPKDDLISYVQYTDQIKQQGLVKKQEIDLLRSQLNDLDSKRQLASQSLSHKQEQLLVIKKTHFEQTTQRYQHDIRIAENQLQELRRQHESIQSQQDSVQKTIDQFTAQRQKLTEYYCKKIESNCPFIDAIQESNIIALDAQLERTQAQIIMLGAQMQDVSKKIMQAEESIMQKNNILGSFVRDVYECNESDYLNLTQQIQGIINSDNREVDAEKSIILGRIAVQEKLLAQMRSDYQFISLSGSQELLIEYHQLQSSLADCIQDLQRLSQSIIQIQSIQSQYKTSLMEKEKLESQLQDIASQLDTIHKSIEFHQSKISSAFFGLLPQLDTALQELHRQLQKVEDLFQERRRIQGLTLLLEQKVQTATLLHGIFGKELTLFALQSYLPLLQDVINVFLGKISSLELTISLSEEGDALELMVRDELGLREVKSLSGGQKTILRLSWILATSVVFRNNFLLLDETINHVDVAMIAKVAELLSDYMKQYNITFYTVTHSELIQQMNIRDRVIEIIPGETSLK